jgi:hypothetical protein
MKKILSTLLFVFFICFAMAQKICVINNVNAFYTVHLPGMQPVDENGRPLKVNPFVNRTILVSSSCSSTLVINKIMVDGFMAKFDLAKATAADTVDLADIDNKKIYVRLKKGDFLWKIVINDSEQKLPVQAQKVAVSFKWKNKPNTTIVKKWQELFTIPAP